MILAQRLGEIGLGVASRRRIILSIFCAVVLSACDTSPDTTVFRYGHSQSLQSPRSESMLFFKSELESRSAGRIRVENYFSGTLGSEREMMDMVATGVLQGTRGGLFADANPKYVLFMLPFLIGDWDQALALVNSEFTSEINHGAAANGFHIPATGISQGFRAHTNNVRPIKSPQDLHGLKMRVPPQEIYVQTTRAFGASPQELPASDIYSALKTGVLDGQDNPPSNIWDYKVFEVQDFMTVTNYSTGPDPFIVDLRWYEALDPEMQTLFDEVAAEAIAFSDKINRESEDLYIAKLKSELEINFLSVEEQQSFRELVQPVYQHFIESGVLTMADIERARAIVGQER